MVNNKKLKACSKYYCRFFTCFFQLYFIFSFQQSWGGFVKDVGQTANITLSFDVTGSAIITPYIQVPRGDIFYGSPSFLNNETNHIFYDQDDGISPTFSIEDPIEGLYSMGALVHALENTTVKLNIQNTVLSTSYIEIFFRSTNVDTYSVTLSTDEYTILVVPMMYTALSQTPP